MGVAVGPRVAGGLAIGVAGAEGVAGADGVPVGIAPGVAPDGAFDVEVTGVVGPADWLQLAKRSAAAKNKASALR